MKPEIEFKWMVNLLNSEFLKGGIFRKQISGCKNDFEVVAGASQSNKEFRKFLNELIKEDCLEFFEKKKVIGGNVDTYVIIGKLLEKRLMSNSLYSPTRKLFEKKVGFFELNK